MLTNLTQARRAAEKEIPRKKALADVTCGLQVLISLTF